MNSISINQEIKELTPSGIIPEISMTIVIIVSMVAAFSLDTALAVIPSGIPALAVLGYMMHRGVSWRSTPKLALFGCALVASVQALMLATVLIPMVS